MPEIVIGLDCGMVFGASFAQALIRAFGAGIFVLWIGFNRDVQAQEDFAITEFAASNSSAPADEDGDFSDWIEIYNRNPSALSLDGWSLTDDRNDPQKWRFPDGPRLFPGEYLLLVRNRAAFESRYGTGLEIAGEYSGRLDNGGERITLVNAKSEVVLDFTYGTTSPWPENADGVGYSLTRSDLDGDASLAASWRASAQPGGSPGRPPAIARPLIESAEINGTTLRLTFEGRSGSGYTVLSSDSLSGPWGAMHSGARLVQDQRVQMEIPINNASGTKQFFRLASD